MRIINLKFPIVDDKEKNFFLGGNSTTRNALVSNLTLLLSTQKEERLYMPDYGTNLRRNIFEPLDAETQSAIEKDIKVTVSKYIPELTIDNVNFFDAETNEELQDNELGLVIDFTYSEDVFNEQGRLELTF